MRKPWIWIVLLVGALVAGARLLPLEVWLSAFLEWARGTGVWGPVAVAAAYIPATLLFVPGWILTVGAGFAFGLLVGTIAVSIGSTLGTTVAFVLGRTLLRDRIERRMERSPRLQALDHAVARHGFRIVLLMRLSPAFPFNLMGYVFGATRVSFRDHLLASWLGMLPGTVMYVYLGCAAENLAMAAAGEADGRSPAGWALFVGGLLATVAVTVLVARIARTAIHETVPEIE